MFAPDFLKDCFPVDTAASLWFRATPKEGALRGRVVGWEDDSEGMDSYVVFKLISDGVLYLPFNDIYLSTLSEDRLAEAKIEAELEDRAREINRKQAEVQLRRAESGLV